MYSLNGLKPSIRGEAVLLSQSLSDDNRRLVKKLKWEIIDGEIFELKDVDTTQKTATIGNLGAVFTVRKWPKIAPDAVRDDLLKNRALWNNDFQLTEFDFAELERVLLTSKL